MTLKPIPHEPVAKGSGLQKEKKIKKSYNPQIKKSGGETSLKAITSRLVRFINRGSRYTINQIDELIMTLQRSILRLQKEKQNILKRKANRGNQRD